VPPESFFGGVQELISCSVIPISDNGGSSSELIRVFGGPGIGDVRSELDTYVFICVNWFVIISESSRKPSLKRSAQPKCCPVSLCMFSFSVLNASFCLANYFLLYPDLCFNSCEELLTRDCPLLVS